MSCSALLLACREEPPPRDRPYRGPGIGPPVSTPTSNASALDNPVAAPPSDLAPSFQPSAAPAPAAANTTAPAEPDPPRDFSAELLAMLSNAASCLDPRPSDKPQGALQLAIQTQVMPSGAVSNSQVQASGLGVEERQCFVKRIEGLRFGGRIDNAPFPVRATLTLQPAAAPAAPPQQVAALKAWPPSADKPPSEFLEPDPEPAPVPMQGPPPAARESGPILHPDPEPTPVPDAPPVKPLDDSVSDPLF